MERKDWTLLATYFAKEKGLTPAQLQKSLFLIGQVLDGTEAEGYYHFIPYNYGPFDAAIYQDAGILELNGEINRIFLPLKTWPIYRISELGVQRAKEIIKSEDEKIIDFVRRVVEWTQSLTFRDLIRTIYYNFPEYKVNSVFQG